ncbi:MAG: 50S ribosomal protein L7/L12 [Candidatus Uhrbacteria bacterium GW2011_GWC2_53_7]|uniref:50S ribosomal protein L7/L12 n=1 Tax=Candidatus Uhrbacteria bacterium GW2011_GWC2_53_7 TaxID=1618986 RepID=A0A0G2AP64_9BACT|nr:MAG: 50S ribosomal protein L7/L12 [Candidatus Uhrbacteria bacterium GW2011_GWC2_53_7]
MDEPTFEPEPVDGDTGSGVSLDTQRVLLATRILRQAYDSLRHAIDLLDQGDLSAGRKALVNTLSEQGVFDGEQMIGSDGESYAVPVNYASKSRLVEGDMLKLTVRGDGAFVYKQIGPIERRRLKARLAWDASSGSYVAIEDRSDSSDTKVLADGRVWKLLNASVSYFKGQEGDTVLILVPKTAPSAWAAVENVLRDGRR